MVYSTCRVDFSRYPGPGRYTHLHFDDFGILISPDPHCLSEGSPYSVSAHSDVHAYVWNCVKLCQQEDAPCDHFQLHALTHCLVSQTAKDGHDTLRDRSLVDDETHAKGYSLSH